jgi:kinesin family protein 6/9
LSDQWQYVIYFLRLQMGDVSNYEHRGVAPRAIGQIFNEVNSRIEFEFRVTCTYMEIYNERIYDLLADLANPDQAADYTIAEERDGRGTFVRGLTEIEVHNENDTLNLLFGGELSRTTATHKLNRRSNRSHSLFTIYLQQRQRSGVSEKIVHSKLHLIDLAGSERLKKTMDNIDGSTGDDVTRKESMSINQSLTYLEQCVVALARKGQSHIPYRQSKLTNILKDCLGANCNTLMLACMWGEADHLEETVSTLRLASRMMKVQNETATVETVDSSALIKKQARLIKALKQELLMHDALVERTGVAYEPYTPEQQASVCAMLEKYIDAKETEEDDCLEINSFRQMLEVCKQFKQMVLGARAEAAHAREEAAMGYRGMSTGFDGRPFTADAAQAAADNKIISDFDPKTPTVGAPEGRGFSLGHASADSRPLGGTDYGRMMPSASAQPKGPAFDAAGSPAKRASPNKADFATTGGAGGTDRMRDASVTASKDDFPQSALFQTFAANEGSEIYNEFVDSKAYLKELKQKIKESTVSVNDFKHSIDQLQQQVEARKNSRIETLRRSGMKLSETEDIVDEEEFKLMKDLREAKRSYKTAFDQMLKFKGAVSQAQLSADNSKTRLTASFAAWSGTGAAPASSSGDFAASAGGAGGDTDQLDDQEAFDRLEEERVLSNDPDSLAFFHAQKTRRALMTQNSGTIRNMQKIKRLR